MRRRVAESYYELIDSGAIVPEHKPHPRPTKGNRTWRVRTAGPAPAPGGRFAATLGSDHFRDLQRVALLRFRVGRLATDREQPDHPVLEQSAASLWQRPLVSRGATSGLLSPALRRLVDAELHVVRL